MIIISKKRIMNLLTIIVVCLTVATIKNITTVKNTVETVSLPVTNKVIVIDAGHGIPDERGYSLKLEPVSQKP